MSGEGVDEMSFYKFYVSIVMVIMLMTSVIIANGTDSFLVNGGFEDGTSDIIPGWSRSFYPQNDGSISDCISRTNQRARSGNWSLKIDTKPVSGKEVTLVFNGAITGEAGFIQGQRLVLSGWIYVEAGTALRTISMRLRVFGKDDEGKSVFLGDVLSLKILGKPGEWTQFKASGTVNYSDVTNMDLHCSIRPDLLQTVQFLDDLRLETFVPPSLEIQLLRDALWRDEKILPIDIQLNMEDKDAEAIAFHLMDDQGKSLAEWNRPAQTAIFGLPLPEKLLPQGSYILRCELQDGGGNILESAEASLEIAPSPWEGASDIPQTTLMQDTDEMPEGFRVMGTVAPTGASDIVPSQSETISPDLDLSSRQNMGYAVFSRHYLDEVSRLGRPRPGEFGPIRLFACPGEYEPATVSVWAIRPQKDMRLTVSDLTNENGRIASENIDVRIIRTASGLPSFLEKRKMVDIPEDETLTYWLTIHVPPDADPGFYRANIKITTVNIKPTQVELLLRVLPLKLPPPPRGYGFWWKMDTRWDGYYSKERDEALEQIRKQFVMLREHGCNMVSCYGMPKMTKGESHTISFNFEQDHWGHNAYSLADFFRLGKETGFLSPDVPIQYTGADSLHSDWIARFAELDAESNAFDDFYRDACSRVDGWAKEQGFELAFACIDEIGNSPERRQDALRFYRIVQEAGVLTSVTDNSMHGGVHLMGQSRFNDIIDMRLYNFITPEMIEHTQQSGDVLWLYNMASGGWEAKRDRFVFGLFTERCGAAGYSQWAFQWSSGNANPYEAAMAGKRSGYHYALPAPDGPLPTVALEGVREGIDDARYLAYLRQRNPEAEAAYLSDIEPFSTKISEYLGHHRGNFLDLKRWRIARQAMELK
jgi:hypothetical protein